MRCSLALVVTFLAGVLPGQQNFAVVPSDHTDPSGAHAALPGAAVTALPLGLELGRVQFLYEAWDIGIPDGATITHLGFMPGPLAGTGGDLDLEIFAGTSTLDADTMTRTFAANYAGVRRSVFGRRVLVLPDFGTNREPIWIALDRPFTFDATRNLILDYELHGIATTKPQNYLFDEARLVSPQRSFGAACPASTGASILMSEMHAAIGTTWRPRANAVVRGSIVVLLLGSGPIEPGLSLQPIGAPGCELSVRGVTGLPLQVPVVTNTVIWAVPIPFDLGLLRSDLFAQAIMFDPPANALGIVTGRGTQTTLGVWPRIAEINTLPQSSPTSTVAAQIDHSHGLITLFGWQ